MCAVPNRAVLRSFLMSSHDIWIKDYWICTLGLKKGFGGEISSKALATAIQ